MLPTRELAFSYTAHSPENELEILAELCEGFVNANVAAIKADPETYPCCNSCGSLRYSDPQPCYQGKRGGKCEIVPNCQRVKGIWKLLETGYGTCIDLAVAYCSIKRAKDGQDCWVVVDYERDRGGEVIPNRYHAYVHFADGRIVDPAEQAKAGNTSCEDSCPGTHEEAS